MMRWLWIKSLWFVVFLAGSASVALGQEDEERRGLIRNEPGAQPGYTLIQPFSMEAVLLLDLEGRVVHRWESERGVGDPYLQDNGDIIFCTAAFDAHPVFTAPGGNGRVCRLSWDSSLVWEFEYSSDEYLQHHDIALTPDDTVLMIAWEAKENWEALKAGRDPALLGKESLWPLHVVEFDPHGLDGPEIIWEWHVWDHLIQDFDADKENYGDVAAHPERVDINGDDSEDRISAEELKQLQALGYVADAAAANRSRGSDWLHCNGIDYNADLDQIVLSVPTFGEFWIIDHSTTTDEAATSEGGNSGRGGDLLYRWGNPRSYRMGTKDDQILEFQHDARWVPNGHPGEGRITVFNNGRLRGFSSVLELTVEPDEDGRYSREEAAPFGPTEPTWKYQAEGFYSSFVSGAHRLPNGNTLICEGATGRILEVTPAAKVVWEYKNPFREEDAPDDDAPYGLFRATRIPADHPALKDRQLQPIE